MTLKAVHTDAKTQKTLDSQGVIHGVIYGVPEGQDARLIADKARALMPDDKVLVHIALDDARMATLQSLLAFFAPDVRVVQFPAWDCLPYDRVSPNGDIVARRVNALNTMLEWEKDQNRYPRVVLTTVNAALQRVMPKTALENARLVVKSGQPLDLAKLQTYLIENGYSRTQTVREAGEYAIRGDIIDLFPPGYPEPLRIDVFGTDVESIRTFDPSTQISQKGADTKRDHFALQPATEFFLTQSSIDRFRAGYRNVFGTVKDDDPLYSAVSEGRRYNGMDHWLPLFHEKLDTLFDYIPGAGITMDYHARESHDERLAQIKDFYEARQTLKKSTYARKKKAEDVSLSGTIYHPLPADSLYLAEKEWINATRTAEALSPFAAPTDDIPHGSLSARKGRDFADIRALPDGDVFGELRKHIISLNRTVVIGCYSEGSRERLRGLAEASAIAGLKLCDDIANVKKLRPGEVGLSILPLDHGFVADDLAVITEQDILGDRLVRKSGSRKKAENFLREVSSLSEGDLVVHIDHGIGRFVALETVKAANTLHDCLKIEYAGGDRLFVPVENIEVLSRFGADEGTVQLDKLGGAGWQARKAKAKKDLMEMADQLLQIAAARQLRKAEKIDIPQGLYNEFAAKFPYQETEDQERAINDVIGDLMKEHPMDRLVCGDVGFGKTEVALRAAYVAAMHGAQVAVAVPTTLLARQHYNNFARRFAGTGLRVEQLSRLVNAKDKKSVTEGLANGSVNIVIGTHALFGKEIKFAHLGLLVVDEEQRFGVKQKERLKEIKNNVHVLTLTATPIPRTLQMALTGVREMSLIATPPVDRLAIRTFILPFDPMVIREAILREHYRGGQIFYVCPRIKDMEEIERELRELVPEVKIIAAHGQLTPEELEDRMSAFYDGQYDVLLATNIIESGIDIPTANTMIVHRADMFGLAQLYQIRGRIGRSKMRAYAYLTYPPVQKLNPQAQKRLEVMETLDTLGSGFQLASHDMDIRGAGNLLGDQQSGHIREIGVELYQQLLEEAVAAAREGTDTSQTSERQWSPQINVGTSVLIPEPYVEDLSIRMSLYRRLSDLETAQDIESFAAEMIDRFGPIPAEVQNLLDIVGIKQFCRKAGVGSIEAGPKGAVIGFYKDSPPNVEKLMRWIADKRGAVKLRPDQKLVVMREWPSTEARVKSVQTIVKELSILSG
jgi:transcription-repair coupling factor (superfamily II helicase)